MLKYVILFFFFSQIILAQTTTIYLIRHAEKVDNSKNPFLSEAGLIRANHWNDIFESVHFDAVYSTEYNRTLQTALPTATKNNVKTTLYDPKTITPEKIKKEHLGQTILIVGHSNTTPELVNKFINKNVFSAIDDATFGNLYIVTVNETIINY